MRISPRTECDPIKILSDGTGFSQSYKHFQKCKCLAFFIEIRPIFPIEMHNFYQKKSCLTLSKNEEAECNNKAKCADSNFWFSFLFNFSLHCYHFPLKVNQWLNRCKLSEGNVEQQFQTLFWSLKLMVEKLRYSTETIVREFSKSNQR